MELTPKKLAKVWWQIIYHHASEDEKDVYIKKMEKAFEDYAKQQAEQLCTKCAKRRADYRFRRLHCKR